MPLDVLARIIDPLRRPVLSSSYPAAPPLLPQSMRGLPEVDPARCERDAGCVVVCPTGAVALDEDSWAIDTGRCIFCAACAEACPTGARVFGNVLDPDSEIRWVLEHKQVFRLKEDLNTEPRFWYFTD